MITISRNKTGLSKLVFIIIKYKALYLMLLPCVLYFAIFSYVPMVGILLAFKQFNPLLGIRSIFLGDWVGLEYFDKFFSSFYFSRIFFNTIIISMLKLIFGFPAPIILAILLNELKNRYYKKLVQTVSYLPHFLSWVIISSVMYIILAPETGLINQIIVYFGGQRINFLGEPNYFRSILVISGIWASVGWSSIIYLAAIAGIDNALYESSEIDGATRLKKVWYITIPGISHIISISLILSIGGLLNAGFDQIYLLYSPPVYEVADIIDTYVYREGMVKMNYSFATAVGLTKSIIAFVLIFFSNRVASKLESGGVW